MRYRTTSSAGMVCHTATSTRVHWALAQPIKVGAQHRTSVNSPASRWPAHIFNSPGMGIEIESIAETPEEDSPEQHARHVVCTGVRVAWKTECDMNWPQIDVLVRTLGLTEARAHALTALIRGAC